MAISNWHALKEAAKQGYSDGILCLATIEIVERLNQQPVGQALNDAGAGGVARILRESALIRMHLSLCRAFAPCRSADDWNLRAAIEFLKEPGRVEEELVPDRRSDLYEAVRLFGEASADPRLKSLKHMRDKLIAHLAVYDESIARPRYDDLFSFARLTAKIWERLSFGAGTCSIEIEHQIDEYRESSDAFWSIWERRVESL